LAADRRRPFARAAPQRARSRRRHHRDLGGPVYRPATRRRRVTPSTTGRPVRWAAGWLTTGYSPLTNHWWRPTGC